MRPGNACHARPARHGLTRRPRSYSQKLIVKQDLSDTKQGVLQSR